MHVRTCIAAAYSFQAAGGANLCVWRPGTDDTVHEVLRDELTACLVVLVVGDLTPALARTPNLSHGPMQAVVYAVRSRDAADGVSQQPMRGT